MHRLTRKEIQQIVWTFRQNEIKPDDKGNFWWSISQKRFLPSIEIKRIMETGITIIHPNIIIYDDLEDA